MYAVEKTENGKQMKNIGGYHEQPVGPNLYDQCVNCHQWKSCLQTEGPELFLIWNT